MSALMQEALALDRASARNIDVDGHLHVAESNISVAAVNGYLGKEIPNFDKLGLNPDQIYQLLRHPDELAKGADSFNGKPLLIKHKPQTADDHDHELTVGGVSNVRWKPPYLTAELAVWDADAITGIQSGEQKELSSAYRYDADMTPGIYKGQAYDGVMRNIVGNHIALVESGRAGSDVVVGDAALNQEIIVMASTAGLSRTALLAGGALSAYLRPKLAADAKLDITDIVAGVSARTWKADKTSIKIALDAAVVGKLAKDADLSDLLPTLNLLDPLAADAKAKDEWPDKDKDDDDDDDDKKKKKAEDAKAKAAKAAKDKAAHAADKDDDDDDDDDKKKKKAEDAITLPAMDAAIARAVARARADTETATIARMREIQEAERAVKPYIGDVAMAHDSAAAVYREALTLCKADLTGVPKDADAGTLAAMVRMLPRPGAEQRNGNSRFAQDTSTSDTEAKFRAQFPTAVKLMRG